MEEKKKLLAYEWRAQLCTERKNENGKFTKHMQILAFYASLYICAPKISEGI